VSKSVWTLRIRKLLVISLALVAIILVGYFVQAHFSGSVQNPVYAASDEEAESVDKALVTANSGFAFNLFRELVSEDSGNVFISPLSVSMALAMAYNGAEGTTEDAMSNTLNFGGMSMEKVNQEFSVLIQSLGNVDQSVDLLIGNSVWIRQEFGPNVNASFLQRVQSSYDGEVFTRDFSSSQTVNDINNWIDTKTNGNIRDAISKLDPQLAMLLINAIYFKGEWVTSFNKNETTEQDFYVSLGNATQVDMMQTSGQFEYYSDENCEVARLAYGRDKGAMYIFLPNQNMSLDSFINYMNQTVNDKYISELQSVSNLVVELPKFKVEYNANLNEALTKLGMGTAFEGTANFDGIAPSLFISSVQHNAVIEVNEEGTEAAGATSVFMSFGISHGPTPIFFIVNRPFFFEIRDDRSGSILFMGKILNPV
jgi:serpin B